MPKGIPRNQSINNKILRRLRIAYGQLGNVISMVEKNEYCIDVIGQSRAVQQALKQTDQVILENHLHTCVLDAEKHGNIKSVIKEVITLMDKQDCCCKECDCKDCKCDCTHGKCDCGKECHCTCKSCCCKDEAKTDK